MNAAPRARLGQLTSYLRIFVRQAHSKKKKPARKDKLEPPHHGEQIWVIAHRRTEQVVYSFQEAIKAHHALKQLVFNGKKTKPANIRKDYWSPMAMIQFPTDQGVVGRSVYHKLRELKHLHDVAWSKDIHYKSPDEYTEDDKKRVAEEMAEGRDYRPVRSKQERGIALNAQKKYAIADMAVVLAGGGAGNKIVLNKDAEGDNGEKELMEVTVSWSSEQDKEHAEVWSKNVTHRPFENPAYRTSWEPEPVAQTSREPESVAPEVKAEA